MAKTAIGLCVFIVWQQIAYIKTNSLYQNVLLSKWFNMVFLGKTCLVSQQLSWFYIWSKIYSAFYKKNMLTRPHFKCCASTERPQALQASPLWSWRGFHWSRRTLWTVQCSFFHCSGPPPYTVQKLEGCLLCWVIALVSFESCCLLSIQSQSWIDTNNFLCN